MNWMTVLWPMVAGACVALALIHLWIWTGKGGRAAHLFFASAALSIAAISGFELTLMRTTDLARYDMLLRWAVVPIGLMFASLAGFVLNLFGTGRLWLALLAVGLHALSQIVNLLSAVPVVRNAVSLHRVETFGGAWFTVPTIVNGSWDPIELVSVILFEIFVIDASIALWKRGLHRRAVVVGGSIVVFFLAARGHAILVEKGLVQTPYLVSFSFVCVLFAMGHELGDETLRAAQLANDLQESERRIDLAAQAAALGFWNWDLVRDEIWANDTARKLFGVSPTERVNLARFAETLHPEDRERIQAAIEASIAGAHAYSEQYRVMLPGGETRWIAALGHVDVRPKGTATMMRGVVIDITAQRRSEMELQHVHSQLAHAGRVSIMGQLASALAHELNQPLGAILRNAEAAELFLQNETPDLDEIRSIVADIRKDDQRAGDVIDRLRSMLKRRDVEQHALSTADLLSEAAELARSDAVARRVSVKTAADSTLPAVMGDRIHLQQVLLNLLLNAMDAMVDCPEGTREVLLQAEHNGNGDVEFSVSDSGHGIPPEKLAHLFEPFYTTKSHGMGIGLAISQTIIQSHNGRIWAENNTGRRGATFRFTLPVAQKTA